MRLAAAVATVRILSRYGDQRQLALGCLTRHEIDTQSDESIGVPGEDISSFWGVSSTGVDRGRLMTSVFFGGGTGRDGCRWVVVCHEWHLDKIIGARTFLDRFLKMSMGGV